MAEIVALIHGEAGAYGVSFPDFPGVASGGATLDEAMRRSRETLAVHVEALTEEGRPIPTPRALDALRGDAALEEGFADAALVAVVSVDLPGRARRFNISMDERLMERIDARARVAGETRSGFLAAAARRRLSEEA